jgi:hypothetical protein
MEQQVKERIAQIVRRIVADSYGLKTCVATIKVLQKVLELGWGVEMSPHVVSLKVVPRESVEIMNDEALSLEEKQCRASMLPAGTGPITIESTHNEIKFHVVGLTQLDGDAFIWDPSIDQVNQELYSCHFGPLVLAMSHSRIDSDGNINFDIDGCLVAYKEVKELEEKVYALDIWRDDYSDLVTDVMRECSNHGLQGSLRLAARP